MPIAMGCGHTFCAGCILPWYFMNVFTCCEWWHEVPFCPLCRYPCPVPPVTHGPYLQAPCPLFYNAAIDQAIDFYMALCPEFIETPEFIDYIGRRK